MKFSFLVLGFLVFVISVLMLTACPGNNLSTDANLKELSLAGELISGFDPLIYEYNVQLPAGTSEIPEITYIKNHPHQKIVVNLPASLPGIATVIVIAEDNTTMKAYRIVFSLAPSNNAYLRTLEYNGQSVPGFSKEKTEYEIFLPGGSFEVPEIVAIPELPNSIVVITKPNSLPGTVKIEVIAEDGVTKKLYSINFQLMASNDASLKSLKYDGMDVPGFDKDKTTYLVVLPEGTSQVPLVSAVASDPKASIKITQAVSLPGTAAVQVTAEDGVTKRVYTVEFVTALSDDATLKSL
ncbi:MAG: cadherin-like beta sandwich domain-containing protein, partial [Mesotoga sp.]|uniref:cadherin-like beta sandwich domain-containing protein n=1 Tax=Mesotoga sp. TaxID=2053577 RepID=UPI00356447E8